MAEVEEYKKFLRRHVGMVGELIDADGRFTLHRGFDWRYGFYILESVGEEFVRLRWDCVDKRDIPITKFAISTSHNAQISDDWIQLVSYHLGSKISTRTLGWLHKPPDPESAQAIYSLMSPGLNDSELRRRLSRLSGGASKKTFSGKFGTVIMVIMSLLLLSLIACWFLAVE